MPTGPARALLRRLGQFLDGFSGCFSGPPQAAVATRYVDGLFNDSERKSMQAMHGRLSDPQSYQALQHFITHSPWDAERVWRRLRAQVPTRAGILALDDTGFPKQGTHSVGVQRQYCGALGKIGNCQVAVSSALLADGRTWPLTFELYLPTSWMDDPQRRVEVGIPPTLRFREKWRIALTHVRTVLKSGFTLRGVVVDADYGANATFRAALERLGLRYGVAIRGEARFQTAGRTDTARHLAMGMAGDAWHTVTWGPDPPPRLTGEFAAVRVRAPTIRGERWLLCERTGVDAFKFYLLNLDATASLEDLVALARSRWPIEQQYRELKDDLGLDHFEGRSYRGWHHHVVLTAVAFTFLQLERGGDAATLRQRPTLPTVRGWVREIFGLLYVIHTPRLRRALESFRRNPPLRR